MAGRYKSSSGSTAKSLRVYHANPFPILKKVIGPVCNDPVLPETARERYRSIVSILFASNLCVVLYILPRVSNYKKTVSTKIFIYAQNFDVFCNSVHALFIWLQKIVLFFYLTSRIHVANFSFSVNIVYIYVASLTDNFTFIKSPNI